MSLSFEQINMEFCSRDKSEPQLFYLIIGAYMQSLFGL